MINSRALSDLNPTVMKLCMEFMARCREIGIDIIITSTWRDHESQQALYNQGRLTKGNIVTNAKPGFSFHNYKVAFDFAPIKMGKIDWADIATFKKCGAIAKEVGLDYAGDWTGSLKEYAHCQQRGVTIEQLRAKYPNGVK